MKEVSKDSEGKSSLREGTATLIALVTVALAAWTLLGVYSNGGKVREDLADRPEVLQMYERAFARQKDIMLYTLTLLGTVLGYYFGRVPAERRAEKAEEMVDGAQNTASQAVDAASRAQRRIQEEAERKEIAEEKIADAKITLMRIQQSLQTTKRAAKMGLGSDHPLTDAAGEFDVLTELTELSRRLD